MSSTMIQIPVRMGSHRFQVTWKGGAALTSGQLVELAIEKCHLYVNNTNIERLRRTYAVFESVNGVERRMRRADDIVSVLKSAASASAIEFVVRKQTLVEKQLVAVLKRSDAQTRSVEKRCYRKLKRMENKEIDRIEVYEDIDAQAVGLCERIRENERVLKKQAEKLNQLEESIIKRIDHLSVSNNRTYKNSTEAKVSIQEVPIQKTTSSSSSSSSCQKCKEKQGLIGENIGILRTLYAKLRAAQQQQQYQQQKDNNKSISSTCSRVALLSADYAAYCSATPGGGNSCGNSDDENEYAATTSRSSTSTLESLV